MTTGEPTTDESTTGPATGGLDLRTVEQFLYREARCADEHRYDEWESLWTDDGLYWVPANDDDADRMTRMSIIHDNRNRIATRIRQYKTGRRHSQVPASRLSRVVSNIEIVGTHPETGDTEVGASFVLVESRERGTRTWAGRYTYRLRRREDGTPALAYKKVALVDNARAIPTLAFLILMDIRPDIVGNEFAEVSVQVDGAANSRRLRIEDLRTGRVRHLDALELETLVWLPDGHLARLLDPSADRWREDP